jgi:hypothetical protein
LNKGDFTCTCCNRLNLKSIILGKKKRKKGFFGIIGLDYGRFLSISIISAIPTMRMMIIAATAGRKYASTIDGGVGVGVGFAAASLPIRRVDSADDGQYALDPVKLAMIV